MEPESHVSDLVVVTVGKGG